MVWFGHAQTSVDVLSEHRTLSPLFSNFYDSFARQQHIPLSVLELCRQRLAQLHQCQADSLMQQCSLPMEQQEQLSRWPSSPAFSEAERACLEFAEVYCIDVQAISDDHADAVKTHYQDAGLIVLLQALGVYYGLVRMGQVWGLQETAP